MNNIDMRGEVMGTHALDCSAQPGKVARLSMCPHHKSEGPKAICIVDPQRIALAATEIMKRVRWNRRSHGAMSYVFVRPDMRVYVISDQNPSASRWASDIDDRWRWLVGVYTARGRHRDALAATVVGLTEDIAEHLRGN